MKKYYRCLTIFILRQRNIVPFGYIHQLLPLIVFTEENISLRILTPQTTLTLSQPITANLIFSAVFPEGWLWSNHGEQVMALTYETPYDQYSNAAWVTNSNLIEIGSRNVYSIAEYLELSHPKWNILDNKNAIATGSWNTDTTGLEFYSDNFFTAPISDGSSTIELYCTKSHFRYL